MAEGSSFIAVERDFRCFRSWSRLELGAGSGTTVHDMGQRVAYVNRKPGPGQKTFPVGTMIVKTTQSEKAPEDWQIFAMVKRGGGFNASGASDWEWFELKIADGSPTLLWRGLGPPVGEGYAQGASCNDCHATAKPNDFVQSPGLALSGFLSAHPPLLSRTHLPDLPMRSSVLEPAARHAGVRGSTRSRRRGPFLLLLLGAALLTALLSPAAALANPRPLPFTYRYATQPEGQAEIEQYADMTPVRALSVGGEKVVRPLLHYQTEFEYGITDKLELGLYFMFQPTPADATGSTGVFEGGNGLKQRLRYRLAEAGEWPVDIALYGEVAETDREIELEAKIILEKRFGKLRLLTNLWVEREMYYDGEREWVLHPTAGATFQATPIVHPGFEWWMRAEYPDEREETPAGSAARFNARAHHYAGPVLLLQFGRVWWVSGAYVRLDQPNRAMQVGDLAGHVWIRSIVGISVF